MNCYLFQILAAPLQPDTSGKEQSRPGHEVEVGTEFGNRFDRFESFPDRQNFGSGNLDSHKEESLGHAHKCFFSNCAGLVVVIVLYVEQSVD